MELNQHKMGIGVSAEKNNLGGGLGAIIGEGSIYGFTGYMEYSLPFFKSRLQLDLFNNKEWLPQLALGIPLKLKNARLEPHLSWELERNPKKPTAGFRLQILF